MSAPPESVFISYQRKNQPFAERLELDLRRAGLTVWRDLTGIELGEDFANIILPAIHRSTCVVLLASPESAASAWVLKEVAEATERKMRVVPLQLARASNEKTGPGGWAGKLPAEWKQLNMVNNAVSDYWTEARRLAVSLHAPQSALPSVQTFLDRGGRTVAEAATELGGAHTVIDTTGRPFVQLPVAPAAYGMTWLFAPADAPMKWPADLGVLFNFTSKHPGVRHLDALAHWAKQVDGKEPWLLMVEGPIDRDKREYDMRTDCPHEWADGIGAGERAVEEFGRHARRVGFYFNCLLPLAFEVGLRTTMMNRKPRRVYHYGRAGYDVAFDSW